MTNFFIVAILNETSDVEVRCFVQINCDERAHKTSSRILTELSTERRKQHHSTEEKFRLNYVSKASLVKKGKWKQKSPLCIIYRFVLLSENRLGVLLKRKDQSSLINLTFLVQSCISINIVALIILSPSDRPHTRRAN